LQPITVAYQNLRVTSDKVPALTVGLLAEKA
jgi:hypothetical protein